MKKVFGLLLFCNSLDPLLQKLPVYKKGEKMNKNEKGTSIYFSTHD
jgi:hypothetical protein